MNITTITVGACIWQSGRFDPLLRKDKKGRWGFLSANFDREKDRNFARQTLERGLFQRIQGTLNPSNFRNHDFRLNGVLATNIPLVSFSSESGERFIPNPQGYTSPIRINIIVPLFEMTQALDRPLPEGFDLLSRVQEKDMPLLSMVRDVLFHKQKEWEKLKLGKVALPMRPDFGAVGRALRNKGIPPEWVDKVAICKNEDYWQPSAEELQNVA